MEAASTPDAPLLTRDGAVPATPAVDPTTVAAESCPIDGVIRCSCCQRYPLVGEQVSRHDGPRRGGWVCQSCEASGRGARLGPLTAVERVRSLGGAMNVRRSR